MTSDRLNTIWSVVRKARYTKKPIGIVYDPKIEAMDFKFIDTDTPISSMSLNYTKKVMDPVWQGFYKSQSRLSDIENIIIHWDTISGESLAACYTSDEYWYYKEIYDNLGVSRLEQIDLKQEIMNTNILSQTEKEYLKLRYFI